MAAGVTERDRRVREWHRHMAGMQGANAGAMIGLYCAGATSPAGWRIDDQDNVVRVARAAGHHARLALDGDGLERMRRQAQRIRDQKRQLKQLQRNYTYAMFGHSALWKAASEARQQLERYRTGRTEFDHRSACACMWCRLRRAYLFAAGYTHPGQAGPRLPGGMRVWPYWP